MSIIILLQNLWLMGWLPPPHSPGRVIYGLTTSTCKTWLRPPPPPFARLHRLAACPCARMPVLSNRVPPGVPFLCFSHWSRTIVVSAGVELRGLFSYHAPSPHLSERGIQDVCRLLRLRRAVPNVYRVHEGVLGRPAHGANDRMRS